MMRRRTFLFLLMFTAALGTARADVREELGPEKAQLVTGVIAQLYPGAQIEWMPVVTLVTPAERRPLRIGDIDIRREADGTVTGVVSFELTAERGAIMEAAYAFEPTTARSPAEIVGFKANAQLAITAVRRGTLNDPASLTEQVEDLTLTPFSADLVWPEIYVTYSALYATREMHGQIKWDTKLVLDPAVVAEARVPLGISRTEKAGVQRFDRVALDLEDENTILIGSKASGQIITRCPDPCLPNGKVLLALWWTTSTAVAAP